MTLKETNSVIEHQRDLLFKAAEILGKHEYRDIDDALEWEEKAAQWVKEAGFPEFVIPDIGPGVYKLLDRAEKLLRQVSEQSPAWQRDYNEWLEDMEK